MRHYSIKNLKIKSLFFIIIVLILFVSVTPASFDITNNIYSPQSESIEIVKINSLTNGSITLVNLYLFNWTKIENASYYNLQIANDSTFTDVFLNLTNISITNYPGNYTESTDYVEFTLPEEYRKEWFKKYYIRVRSFTK
jgi:hypothetical protein